MKKIFAAALAMVMMLSLVACGGNKAPAEAPDLTKYYEDFMATLGEGNTPAMVSANDDASYVDSFFPGLNDVELKQSVLMMAAMAQVGFEIDLVECANADDVETVKGILQARIDSQVAGGAFYPSVAEAWEKAELIVNGNVVALICAGEAQDSAVEAFNALFA